MTKKIILFILPLIPIAGAILLVTTGPAPRPASSKSAAAHQFPDRDTRKKIDRISITRHPYDHGTYRTETTVIERSSDTEWRMISPIASRVNDALLHEVLGAIETMNPKPLSVAEAVGDLDKRALTNPHGIEVSASSQGQPILAVVIGLTQKNTTFLRRADETTVLEAPGRLRKVFDRSPSQLRLRRITDFAIGSVTRVTFHGNKTAFTIVKTQEAPQRAYRPQGTDIENFDVDRAIHRADALSRLYAKAFYDKPHRFSEDALRVTLDVTLGGSTREVVLTFGGKDPETGLHFAASSLSDQVFLLSPYMRSLFTATPSDFALTDDQVRKRQEWQAKMAAHRHVHDPHHHIVEAPNTGSDDNHVVADPYLENHVE